VEKITWSNFCFYLTSIEFKVLALNDNLFSKIVVFFQSLYSFFFIKLPEFFNYIISNKMVVSSLAIIIIFIFFMYIRSSLPRYKLIDFVELYWKHILVYVIILIIIYIFGGGSDSGLDIN
jgi:NADH:ubiquinone oxidoreductase subunit H